MPDMPTEQPQPAADQPRKDCGSRGGGGRPSVIPISQHGAECDGCFSLVLDQFAKSFDKSAKRWELIVYPSLFAFIILAMYGFFLIYSLTQDIRTMAVSIDPKMGVNMTNLSGNIQELSNNVELMATHLEYISDNMETMSVDMQTMSEHTDTMAQKITLMSTDVRAMTGVMGDMSVKLNTLGPMATHVAGLNQAVQLISNSVGRMGYDMNSVTRPMSFMNRFMPW